MSKINLYKISDLDFKNYLDDNYESGDEIDISINGLAENEELIFSMKLYYDYNDQMREVSSGWIFDLCGVEPPSDRLAQPKCVLWIENIVDDIKNVYAASFGSAFHQVKLYSNKQWAFDFIKRVDFNKVKLTASTIPNSKRNKQINSYVNFNTLAIDSGEALNRMDAELVLPDDLEDTFSSNFNVGDSLKFNIKNDDLESIAQVIDYIEYVRLNCEFKNRIPRLQEINNQDKLERYNKKLCSEIFKDAISDDKSYPAVFNQFPIYSSDIRFLDDYDSFIIKFGKIKSDKLDELNMDKLYDFIIENNISKDEDILNKITIQFIKNGDVVNNTKLKYLLYFDYDDENCIFDGGEWMEYNKDYLKCLDKSLNEIYICPDSNQFNFYSDEFFEFILYSYNHRDESKGIVYNCTKEEFLNESNQNIGRFAGERYFNEFMEMKKGYINYDRKCRKEGANKIEIMDLYKDGTVYAVKIGSSSSDLAYVVDQSLEGLKFIRNSKNFYDEIRNVCLWIILKRNNEILADENGNIFGNLNMIILKNRINEWKNDILRMGYKPVIKIDYKRPENYRDAYCLENNIELN